MVNATKKREDTYESPDSSDISSSDGGDNESEMADEPENVYFFGVDLTAENPEQTWDFSGIDQQISHTEDNLMDLEEDGDALRHVLHLRNVVLGKGAKSAERNIVEILTQDVDGNAIQNTIASLTVGVQEMASLQLDFEAHIPVTMRLIEGSGPICLSGMHYVALNYNLNDVEELDATADLEDLSDNESLQLQTRKRKKSSASAPKTKKARMHEKSPLTEEDIDALKAAEVEDEDEEENEEDGEEDDEEDGDDVHEEKDAMEEEEIELHQREKRKVLVTKKKRPAISGLKGKSPVQVSMKKPKPHVRSTKKPKKLSG